MGLGWSVRPASCGWRGPMRVIWAAGDRDGGNRSKYAVFLPFHIQWLRDIGLTLGKIFDLEAPADDCARRSTHALLQRPAAAGDRPDGIAAQPAGGEVSWPLASEWPWALPRSGTPGHEKFPNPAFGGSDPARRVHPNEAVAIACFRADRGRRLVCSLRACPVGARRTGSTGSCRPRCGRRSRMCCAWRSSRRAHRWVVSTPPSS